MEFVVEKQLTNVREPKDSVAEIVTTPTHGGMRITDKACAAMEVTTGDYVAIVQGKANGERVVVAFKGWVEKDEAGKATKTVGSKLASASGKMGGNLGFSASSAYQTLGGKKAANRHFSIGEGFSSTFEGKTVTMFPLIYREETAVAPRQKADAAVEA